MPALQPLLDADVDAAVALRLAARQTRADAARICLQVGADPVPKLKIALEREKHWLHEAAEADPSLASLIEEARQKCHAMIELLLSWIRR